MLKFHNTLTKQVEPFTSTDEEQVTIYSCGPTVYDHVHIGNLSSFIFSDTLRRVITNKNTVKHVMNFTDVDDKTIRRSKEKYPELEPMEALGRLTKECGDLFLEDMKLVGNDIDALTFVKATDEATIAGMKKMIEELLETGFAYTTDDGVYFSIENYKKSGKIYGQLIEINTDNTSSARIDNDEYDKDSVHDFALWKKQKPGEPAWEFRVADQDMTGRPGWHIECSVMSADNLGQPFDVHTGGIDLIFPHHENEIAQSTAGKEDPTYSKFFIHNEHILVDGKKMSKSLNNFHTLKNITDKGYDPLAFRLLVLQSHYRSQAHFSWDNLEAAQNRLRKWQAMADLHWQTKDGVQDTVALNKIKEHEPQKIMLEQLSNDLNTAEAIMWLDRLSDDIVAIPNNQYSIKHFLDLLNFVDNTLGLELNKRKDVSDEQKQILSNRQTARDGKDWVTSDELRAALEAQSIGVRDTDYGQIWFRL